MREYKFRAWHKDAKEMLQNKHQGYEGNVFRWLKEGQPVEIMQYTGLKDKNGKDIYEGDIIRTVRGAREVSFSKEMAMFVALNKTVEQGLWAHTVDGLEEITEIIGNIYENPELLKGE